MAGPWKPAGTVVEIGCGLNTRFERIDNGKGTWFELDLPDSMALRLVATLFPFVLRKKMMGYKLNQYRLGVQQSEPDRSRT